MTGTFGILTHGRTRRWRGRRGARIAIAAALVVAAPFAGRVDAAGTGSADALAVTGDLPSGHVLVAADLDTVTAPADLLPDGAVTATDHATGARLAGPVGRGEILTDAGLTGRPGGPDPRGARRVVPVPLANPAVADLLEPGALVDLVGPTDPAAPGTPEPVARAARITGVPEGRAGHRSILVEVPEADAAGLAATAAGTPLAVLVHG